MSQICNSVETGDLSATVIAGLLAPVHSPELHALQLLSARGLGGLAVPLTDSCSAKQQQQHHGTWLSAPLLRGFAGAAVQPVPPEEDVQLTENAIEASP